MDWTTILAGALAGAVAGTLSSVVAPWVQRAIETRKERDARRATLVDAWRKTITQYLNGGPQHGPFTIGRSEAWQSLKPFLDGSVVERVDAEDYQDLTPPETLRLVSAQVDRLEREWNLI